MSGSFGNDRTDDIFWYAPGTAADYLSDYVPGSTAFQSIRQTVNRSTYRPFSLDIWREGRGNEDILWYAPGLAADGVWDWFRGTLHTYGTSGYATDGEYLTAAGNWLYAMERGWRGRIDATGRVCQRLLHRPAVGGARVLTSMSS